MHQVPGTAPPPPPRGGVRFLGCPPPLPRAEMHVHMHTQLLTHAFVYICSHMYAHVDICIHMYACACICMHIHVHSSMYYRL